jgi:hypothetical protein
MLLVMLNARQVQAFILGDELPPEVVDEIEMELDIPDSTVQRMCAWYAYLAQRLGDEDSPIFDDLD